MCGARVLTRGLCAGCLTNTRKFISRTICPFQYEYPINRLIQNFKFHDDLDLSGFFSDQIIEKQALSDYSLPEIILPVPLHMQRIRQRGFNQSLELAKMLAKKLGLELLENTIVRNRDTPPQSGLDMRMRRTNLRGAFKLIRIPPVKKHVAIVDDVLTTGATSNEVARVLKSAGFERIDLWVCART